MKQYLILFIALLSVQSYCQPNCNIYKTGNDESCYQACLSAIEAEKHQASRQAQIAFDAAIASCPKLDYAWVEKSVPYLKTGNFIEWKNLIDKAVEINPSGNLGYRGWCQYQFVRNYEGAIDDFEMLASLTNSDIGYSQNGDYHLNIVKALCYRSIGQKEKAISIMEDQLNTKDYSPLIYDYLHLGVLKLEVGDTAGAIRSLQQSILLNDYLAEPYYYLGLIYKTQNRMQDFVENMEKAREYYLKGYKHFDTYTHPMDNIYLSDIEAALVSLN